MTATLLQDAIVLVLVVGSLLYGFLARELWRRADVLPRNRPLRWLAACLALWYAGCLADEVLTALAGVVPFVSPALDLSRSAAILLAHPLLAHSAWWLVPEAAGRRARPLVEWTWLSYATTLVFVPAFARAWIEGRTDLARTALDAYPLLLLHGTLAVALAAWWSGLALRRTRDPTLARFIRWLLVSLAAWLLLAHGGGLAAWLGQRSETAVRAWALAFNASQLVLGVTFLRGVIRLDVFRLSLSLRSLRWLVGILIVVAAAMALGPVAGAAEAELHERLVAATLVFVAAGALAARWLERAADRHPQLGRWLGRRVRPGEVDALARRLQSLELEPRAMLEATAEQVAAWFGAPARFLDRPGADAPELEVIWATLADPEAPPFDRVDAPHGRAAAALARLGLEAAFPLRAEGRLVDVLGVSMGRLGGLVERGRREAVQLVLRQLGSALALRRVLDETLDGQRAAAERETLSALGLVAASLAHELRNPLGALRVLAQTVQEELAERDESAELVRDLEVMVEQVDRLSGVAGEILGFVRPHEEGRVELARLVRSSAYVLGHEARRRGVSIDTTAVTDPGRVPGSAAAWQSVLFNLLVNGVRHADEGTCMQVRLRREDDDVVLEIENQGAPIPADVRDRLFLPFVTTGGTGLGLSLVARSVHRMGGEVTSTDEDGRVTFAVRVPAGEAGEATAPEEPQGAP